MILIPTCAALFASLAVTCAVLLYPAGDGTGGGAARVEDPRRA